MFNAEFLKKHRKNNGYTLKTVAEYVGISVPYISSLEKGRIKNPSYSVIENLAKLFRVDPQDFMTGDDPIIKEPEPIVDITVLRDIRFTRKWSLSEAAERAGLNKSTLSLIENGKRRAVSMTTLTKLATAYHVDVNDLLLKREEYVDLTALVMQSDTVIIDGEEIDVSNEEAMNRLLTVLKMGAAWAREVGKGVRNDFHE